MTEPQRLDVLAVGPHPDDVELCCGGTLAVLADRGWRVGVLDLTRGELASNGTPETRAEEAAAASEVLGVTHRENLGLPDGFLDASAGYGDPDPARRMASSQLGRLVEALRRLRPRLVLAPWRQARHPDHAAASELVTRAFFFSGVGGYVTDPPHPATRPGWLVYYPMRVDVAPSFVVDVSSAHARKVRAVSCYTSQMARREGDLPTASNDPRHLGVVWARDRTWGGHIGVAHGEAFVTQATLGVVDPMALLSDNPFDAPLLVSGR